MKWLKDVKPAQEIIDSIKKAEQARIERDKRRQVEEIKTAVEKLEKTKNEQRINYTLDRELYDELKALGYVLRDELDGGPQGSGWTFTYISLPEIS
jgi:hypothetical protein